MSRTYRHGRPTIGVLAGWQFAWTATPLSYLEPIYYGACLAAHDLGCNLLLGCGMGSWTHRSDSLRPAWPSLSSESDFVPIGPWNTDGLVAVNPLHSPARSRYLQELRKAGHPLIFVAAGERGPTIVADNRSGTLQAMQHLVDHGHQRIAFIAGSPADVEGDTGERLQAYHEAVDAHGLPADPHLVAWGQHLYSGGSLAMREILATGAAFTAVLASNDESAIGAMDALREAGYRIPQDVAIAGFDDRPESAVQEPPLTSVRVPLRKMGYRAVESLFRYLQGQSQTIESARIATRLVTRESCGCVQTSPQPQMPTEGEPRSESLDWATARERWVRTMAEPIQAEAQALAPGEIEALCQRLIDAFNGSVEQGDPEDFQDSLEQILRQVAASGDEVHIWQAALSGLGATCAGLPSASERQAHEWLEKARANVSGAVQQQFRQSVVGQRWKLNRLGTLTARLLAALDETQVYRVLAEDLPTMGAETTWIAQFGAEGDDPAAWTSLRTITREAGCGQDVVRFPSRGFPPDGLLPADQSYCLALFPLTGPRGQFGYVAFDTRHLDLYGAITQQIAVALNSARLYQEATEGRRLAEEATELKSRFLSTVSHELRTPLNLIVGLSGILLEEGELPLPETQRQDVEQIYANARHLGGLIGDVLDLASSDAGHLRLANEFVDLGEALSLVSETGRQLAHDKGLEWQAVVPGSGPWVWGDRTRLRQIVLNLVNNAVKFTDRGQVCLKLESGDDSVTVMVSDTGLGIQPDDQSLIFDEFRRSEQSMERGYGGLGLGLAICKRLVQLHGGTIGVQSSGKQGDGSTFYFTLPTAQPPADQTLARVLPPPTHGSVLILINRAGSSRRLRKHLEDKGFDVRMVFTDETPDWLSQLVVSPPGAVVVDVSAAPQQGWVVLKAIKGHPKTQDLPVLFYSLSPDGGSVLKFDYLTKPIELADLTRALDQHWLVPDADHGVRTILVVDDDPATLEMHARIVQAHAPSHRVTRARNGLEALEALEQEPIDLVLLDLIMPELDGFGVLEAMREKESTRDIPVIVLTGQVLSEHDMARLNQGVSAVLSKGVFSVDETLAHVDSALERTRTLSSEAQRLVRRAMAYIHEHYADPISRTDLAQHVALSEDYLTFCFRKELGVTPIAYLNRYRIQQARQLLTDTTKSITEIALEVGFTDSSYFSRVFRREVGQSPEAYRHS